MAQTEGRNAELKSKKICRFCLSQSESQLSNIYSKENRLKNSAPLPLQIMACVSIEVFTNDGMPNTICDVCSLFMEHAYRFKQMCKKADQLLRQYPLTGVWPNTLERPKIPDELVLRPQVPSTPKRPAYQINSVPSSPQIVSVEKRIAVPTLKFETGPQKVVPKILNKSSIRILNKNANDTVEPVLSQPVVKRNDAGQMEIAMEILDDNVIVEEPDPIKSATPVETNVFPCPHCERSFPLRQLLDIHMVNHNRERGFECDVCKKGFFSKYDLGKHVLIHTGEKPYECVVCKKAFTRSTLLYRHERIHTDQPKFLCVYCEKPFLSKSELEKHTERHKKKRPFACKICGKSFAFKQGLERHETVHAKYQPFPCQYCEQSFSTPSKLSRHLTAHAGDRPFPCKLCPKSYLLSHHLTRHLRSHSQGSGSYKCYDCDRTFTNRDDLIYHSAVHATQNLVCPLCKEHFTDLEAVTEHIKLHAEGEQYACEFCDLIFMTADRLQTHHDSDHTEDLAAYEEHTKKKIENIKRENSQIHFDETSQDGQQEDGEVIQEFIIEEYYQDEVVGEQSSDALQYVKQEDEYILSDIGDENNVTKSTHSLEVKQRGKPSAKYVSEDDEMEVETLEKNTSEYEDENDKEDDETYEEPPKKIAKVIQTRKTSTQVTPASQKTVKNAKTVTKASPSQSASKSIPNANQRTKPGQSQQPTLPTTIRMKQPAIDAVLQQLPKDVTIVKKDKLPVKKPENESPKAAVRVLSQRIVKQAVDVKETKDIKNKLIKTPVPEKKPSTSPPEKKPSTPATKAKVQEKTPKSAETKKISPKPKASPEPSSSSITKLTPAQQKNIPKAKSSTSTPVGANQKLVEMVIGDRKVKVQKITMTKAEVAAMAKQGKIEMRGGAMILKQTDSKTPLSSRSGIKRNASGTPSSSK